MYFMLKLLHFEGKILEFIKHFIYWFLFDFFFLMLQRNSIEAASNFVRRNRLPPRLKKQILAYMCLRFKAESLNQHQLIEQLPKSIRKSICQHLFLHTVEKVYLFKDVSKEIIVLLVRN